MTPTWIIILSAYVVVITACVAGWFISDVSKGNRHPVIIFLTWIISLLFGPVILLIALYGFVASLFKRK